MRGLLLFLLASVLVMACHESTGLVGHTDSSTDSARETAPPASCGNGVVDSGEECDDGDDDDCNGCTSECLWNRALLVGSFSPGAVVAVPDIPCIPCPFTVEMWFQLQGDAIEWITLLEIPGWLVLEASLEHYYLENEYLGAMSTGVWPEPLVPGTWHHVALNCKLDEGAWREWMVVDGASDMGGMGSSLMPEWACIEPMLIGWALDSEGGKIDDLRISNQALYPISEPYELERYLSVRSDTVALWDFNREVGGVIPDISGNGHDAVLAEGTLVEDDCHLP